MQTSIGSCKNEQGSHWMGPTGMIGEGKSADSVGCVLMERGLQIFFPSATEEECRLWGLMGGGRGGANSGAMGWWGNCRYLDG
jgi:hypothetical protein